MAACARRHAPTHAVMSCLVPISRHVCVSLSEPSTRYVRDQHARPAPLSAYPMPVRLLTSGAPFNAPAPRPHRLPCWTCCSVVAATASHATAQDTPVPSPPSTAHAAPALTRGPLPFGSLPAGILEIPPSPPGAANANTQGAPAQPPTAAVGGTAAPADGSGGSGTAAADGAAAASGTAASSGGGAGLPSERYLEVELGSAAGLDRYWTRFEELFRLNTGSTEELQRLKRCFPATSE